MFSVRELRAQLRLSQAAFADRLGVGLRTVVAWESGRVYPSTLARDKMRAVARVHGLTKRTYGPLPIRRIDADKAARYASRPGPQWRTWSRQKQLSFLAIRAKYRNVKADAQAGRVYLDNNV